MSGYTTPAGKKHSTSIWNTSNTNKKKRTTRGQPAVVVQSYEFQHCESLKSISVRDNKACPGSTAACHVSISGRTLAITRKIDLVFVTFLSYLSILRNHHPRRQFVDIAPQSPSFTTLTTRRVPILLCDKKYSYKKGTENSVREKSEARTSNGIACATPSLARWSPVHGQSSLRRVNILSALAGSKAAPKTRRPGCAFVVVCCRPAPIPNPLEIGTARNDNQSLFVHRSHSTKFRERKHRK